MSSIVKFQDHQRYGSEYATYSRFSSDRQRESSIEDQEKVARNFAEKWGLVCSDPDNLFSDHSESGKTDDRPELQRLMKLIASKRATFKHLLVWQTSRLFRDLADAKNFMKLLRFHGITLHITSTGASSDDPNFDINHTMLAAMDEMQSRSIGESSLRGMIGIVERGKVPSGKCYGYNNRPIEDPVRIGDHGRPLVIAVEQIINPVQAAVVFRIFDLYSSGSHGYGGIAKLFNEEEVPPARNAHKKNNKAAWNHSEIRDILTRDRYRGIVTFCKTKTFINPTTKKTIHKKLDESEWVTVQRPDLRIISDELWDAVQARKAFAQKKSGQLGGLMKTPSSTVYVFSGLLRCGSCGGNLNMWGGPTGHYFCANFRKKAGCQNNKRVHRESLERTLIEQLAVTVRSNFLLSEVKGRFVARLDAALKVRAREQEQFQSRKSAFLEERITLQRRIENLTATIADHGYLTSLTDQLLVYETQRADIDRILASETDTTSLISEREIEEYLSASFAKLADILLGDPLTARAEIQRRITGLTFTPIEQNGSLAYRIDGDLQLFSADCPVMPCGIGPSSTEHHRLSIPLKGIVLEVNLKGKVTGTRKESEAKPINYALAA